MSYLKIKVLLLADGRRSETGHSSEANMDMGLVMIVLTEGYPRALLRGRLRRTHLVTLPLPCDGGLCQRIKNLA